MKETLGLHDPEDERVVHETISHYDNTAEDFWESSKNHDISQNYHAFLEAIPGEKPFTLLDMGCGPGRDLRYFKHAGHHPIGIEGSLVFCEMAKLFSGCEVWHQNFLKLNLPANKFDGVFANASLFHVPSEALPQVLQEIHHGLKPGGILFSSNPRKREAAWYSRERGSYFELEEYSHLLQASGFRVLHHYYRPSNKPPEEQHWLAVISQKTYSVS